MRSIQKIAVANRGEVAVRILQACEELGIETALLHSEADIGTRAYRMARERVCIGPGPVQQSYLNIAANVNGAAAVGADAVHPGFGFLSENADFAQALQDAGIKFIGPSPSAIRLFGDKVSAKKMAEKISVPMIPGYQGEDQSNDTLRKKILEIGLPVIVKAAAGGGGRGLKVIHRMDEALAAIEAARREGLSSFGSDKIFLEKYLDRAKHIEVQIFGDASGKIHALGERECSIQRRHQKVIEEAPASDLDEYLRREILEAAVKIAESARYQSAGTVEFLVQDHQFFFMEMNTRLQVEHPVTELVWGVDLVKAQILTARGEALQWKDLKPRGHAIECRVYTEDPYKNGIPSTGVLGAIDFPMGAGRRYDYGFEEGDEVTAYYDSMIAKIIAWDETRLRAINKMKHMLSETVVFGLKTNIPYLKKLLSHPEFVDGSMTTRMIESHFPKGLEDEGLTRFEVELAKKVSESLRGSVDFVSGVELSVPPNPWTSSWKQGATE